MTAFHYSAKLKRLEGKAAIYTFTPYDMMDGVEYGEFRLDTADWSFTVTVVPRYKGEPLEYPERCIPALIHKIKDAFGEYREMPEKVLFVA
jgi:hypothetical protein